MQSAVNLPGSSTTTVAERIEIDGEERVNYFILVPSAVCLHSSIASG